MLGRLAALRPIGSYGPADPLPDLRPLLCHPAVLRAAYDRLRSKPGNLTPATDGLTLDGVSGATFRELGRQLGSGTFRFRPARRVEIPKAGGGKRPLTVAAPRDKLVQEALRLVLERLFGPTFSAHSHGFRPGRGCHSALREVQLTFKGISWFLEVDLEDCFGSIGHRRLMDHLAERGLTDHTAVSLLWKGLRCPVVDPAGGTSVPRAGTPQGSVLSPLLANIYLDQVDRWLEERARGYHRGGARAPHPEYRRRRQAIGRLSGARAKARAWAELRKLRLPPVLVEDPGFRRLRWVRYADDLLIGVAGPRSEVAALKEDLGDFLRSLGLRLSEPKTLITSATRGQARFLGHLICTARSGSGPLRPRKGGGLRTAAPRPAIYGDVPALVRRLQERGYCRRGLRGVPTKVGRLVHFTPAAIVDHYRVLLLGLGAYYVGATNWPNLRQRLDYILRHSCARTLGSKLRLRTRRKVFGRYGYRLAIPGPGGEVVAELPVGVLAHLRTGFRGPGPEATAEEILGRLSRRTERTDRLLRGPCVLCGATGAVQLHHLRRLRPAVGGRVPKAPSRPPEAAPDYLTEMMRRMNRKQVPLCAPCHRRVHRGEHSGPPLRGLAAGDGTGEGGKRELAEERRRRRCRSIAAAVLGATIFFPEGRPPGGPAAHPGPRRVALESPVMGNHHAGFGGNPKLSPRRQPLSRPAGSVRTPSGVPAGQGGGGSNGRPPGCGG